MSKFEIQRLELNQQQAHIVSSIQQYIVNVCQHANVPPTHMLSLLGHIVGVMTNRVSLGIEIIDEDNEPSKAPPEGFLPYFRDIVIKNIDYAIKEDAVNREDAKQLIKAFQTMSKNRIKGQSNDN